MPSKIAYLSVTFNEDAPLGPVVMRTGETVSLPEPIARGLGNAVTINGVGSVGAAPGFLKSADADSMRALVSGYGIPGGSVPFGVLGDSVSQQCSDYAAVDANNTTQIMLRNDGYMPWACALSGQQITFDPATANFGLGGDTLFAGTDGNGTHPGIMSRVASVIASGVRHCVVLGGHNDVTTAGTSYTDICTRLAAIVAALQAGGVRVYLGTLVPVSGMNSARYAKLLSVNQYIRRLSQSDPRVVLVDWWAYINDFTAASPQQKQYWNRYNDTLHPGVKSAYAMGYVLWRAIKAAMGMSDQTYVMASQSDAFDATNGPLCSLNANPAMTGTAGTATTAGGATNATVSGQVADSWTVQKYGGSSTCTVTCSKESPRTDLDSMSNGARQVVAFTTTQSGGGSETIEVNTASVTVASGKYAAGERLLAECSIELSNPVDMYGVSLLLSETHTVAYQKAYTLEYPGNSANQPNALMDNTARTYKYVLRTPVITTASNSQSVVGQVRIVFHPSRSASGASGTVKIGDFAIRKA